VRQFNARLEDDIASALRNTGVDPQLIELEITESLFMQDPVMVGAILQTLSQRGARVALDDFGTGFSSLTSLKRFFVHTLKIDRSFIHDIENDPQDVAIVRAVIAMARSIGVRVVAEGVEGEAQLQILRALECDEYQGFLFAPPMTPADIEQRFAADTAALPA
jgi:diguanylate cyclase